MLWPPMRAAIGGNLALERSLWLGAGATRNMVSGDHIYDVPSGLNYAIFTGKYKVQQSLQRRRGRRAMETVAERGHTGEEAWTIMTMDGEECVSSGVHKLGVFFGYMGWNSHRRTTNEKRKDYLDCEVDTKSLLPCFMKAK